MQSWAKWCLGGCLLAAVLGALGAGLLWSWISSQPRQWECSATLEIAAPPEEIRPLLEDLRRWGEWSAWVRDTDPSVHREFDGAERGTGAGVLLLRSRSPGAYAIGRVEIVSAGPDGIELVTRHYGALVFAWRRRTIEPHGSSSAARSVRFSDFDHDYEVPGSIRLERTPEGTRVTWRESVDLGDSLIARFSAAGKAQHARPVHEEALRLSLEGLRKRLERR